MVGAAPSFRGNQAVVELAAKGKYRAAAPPHPLRPGAAALGRPRARPVRSHSTPTPASPGESCPGKPKAPGPQLLPSLRILPACLILWPTLHPPLLGVGDFSLLSAGEVVTRAPAVLFRVNLPGLNPCKLAWFLKPAHAVPRKKGLGPHTPPSRAVTHL